MFGSSSAVKNEPPTVAPQAADDRFSLVELRRIYKQLVENKTVTDSNQDLVIEILRVIAEMVVYGDNKSELLFDFFCEKSMLSLFLEIMHSDPVCPVSVHVQILQTLSILISCVKNDTSLYYLLSNNHINDILVFRHDFNADESLSAQFASFMKTLSLRLNDQTVQFFFREDSGAFPLLTKAVELLGSKDPMIRISAQSTILNIFRVKEDRALEYALREDNLFVLLECIVGIMKDQFESLCSLSSSYLQSHYKSNSDPSLGSESTLKIEQNVDDCIIQMEDWIYYLQDAYELNIDTLQTAMTAHILNSFVYPMILGSCLEVDKSSPTEMENPSSDLIARVDVAMFYLLQLGRIFPSVPLRRAIIVAISHPTSQASRAIMLTNLRSCGGGDSISSRAFTIPEDLTLTHNLFRQGLQNYISLLNQEVLPQKMVTLTMYAIHGILHALFQDYKNIDFSSGPINFEMFLIACGFLPHHKCAEIYESMPQPHQSFSSVGPSGDFLSTEELLALRIALVKSERNDISHEILEEGFISSLSTVIKNPEKYSVSSLQAACLLLCFVCHVVICAGDVIDKNLVHDIVDGNSPDTVEKRNRFLAVDRLSTLGNDIQIAIRQAASVLFHRAESSFAEMVLIIIREETERFQGRYWKEIHPKMFSEKGLIFPSPPGVTDVMGLDYSIPVSQVEIVRKEVQTFLMLRSILHYLSTSLASFGDGKMCPFEFSTFISDCSFLCLEEESIIPMHLKTGSPFDMKGKKFLDSTVIIPPSPQDSGMATSVSNASVSSQSTGSSSGQGKGGMTRASSLGSNASTNVNNSSQPNSTSSSIFSFGLFGSGNKSNASSPSVPGNANGKLGKDVGLLNGATLGSKLLFVQDLSILQLVSASKVDGKSVFKTNIVAPLLYVDAKLDLSNKKRLKLMVRSYKNVVGMRKIETMVDDGTISNNAPTVSGALASSRTGNNSGESSPKAPFFSSSFHSNGAHHTNPSSTVTSITLRPTMLLKPARKASMYEIELMMDTEQAATLAIQHVENRRRHLQVLKIEELKKKLSLWMSDRRHWSDCIPNSES